MRGPVESSNIKVMEKFMYCTASGTARVGLVPKAKFFAESTNQKFGALIGGRLSRGRPWALPIPRQPLKPAAVRLCRTRA